MPAATERVLQLRTTHADFYGSLRGLNTKALREKGGALVKEIRTMSDAVNEGGKVRDFTAEEEGKWRTVNEHYDVLKAELDDATDPYSPRNRVDRLSALETEMREPAGDPRVGRDPIRVHGGDGVSALNIEQLRSLSIAAWFRAQMGEDLDDRHLAACKATGMRPGRKYLDLQLYNTEQFQDLQARFRQSHYTQVHDRLANFKATLSDLQGSQGAYTVPPETLIRQLEINLLYYGGVRQVAETIMTSTGERMSWPTADDTSNTGVQLGENTTIGSSVDPAFGKVYWDAWKFSSKPVLVPFELLQDSVFNLPSQLGEMLGVRLGRITNTKYTTGTGAATAKGIVICAGSGVTAAGATTIAADELIGLFHSIDPAYRFGLGWMMHDNIVLALRKLKDGQSRYLWQDGLQNSTPDRLLGWPITINQDMQSSIATATKTIIFGQLGRYKIRRVQGIRMYRLEERYRDTDQDAFIAFLREDGNLLDAGTTPVKYLLQA